MEMNDFTLHLAYFRKFILMSVLQEWKCDSKQFCGSYFLRVGDVYGGHFESTFVESRSSAQLLDDLHHDSLWEVKQQRA